MSKAAERSSRTRAETFLLIRKESFGEQNIIVNAKKSSFSRMIFTVGRLIRTESRERFKMISESRMDYAVKIFGNDI